MSDVANIADILDAIKTTLGAAAGLARSQSYDELTEGMQDTPTLQIYPASGGQDVAGENDRTSFRAGVQQEELVVHADLYARQRSHIAEDMGQLVTSLDAIRAVLKAQKTKPYFGLPAIKAFAWTWERVIFEYGDQAVKYVGARFIIKVRMF